MLSGLDANEVRLSSIAGPNLLLSPDLHSRKRARALKKMSASSRVDAHFSSIAETVSRIDSPAIEYDLTDALPHFLEKTDTVRAIGCAKKNAEPGDLVVSRLRPYLREMSVVPRREVRQLFSTEFVVLRPKPEGAVSPQTLQALLLCALPQAIFARSQYGVGHPRFYEFALTEMPIPDSVIAMNAALTEKMGKAAQMREKAVALHRDAESKLLKGIGLDNWRPGGGAWAVKTFSESFGASGRLDAEYHSPKYDQLLDALRRAGCVPLGELADIRKSIEPGSDAYRENGIPFLRVADFTKFGFSDPAVFLDPNEHREILAELGPKKDSVLLTKDGTVGIAFKAEDNMEAITSGAFLHLTVRAKAPVSPDYLALALNSMPVQMQAERDMGGIVIAHWRPDQIRAVLIPLPPPEEQRVLDKLSRESFRLRRESKRILNAAVRAVECAVEKGEKEGLKLLEELTE